MRSFNFNPVMIIILFVSTICAYDAAVAQTCDKSYSRCYLFFNQCTEVLGTNVMLRRTIPDDAWSALICSCDGLAKNCEIVPPEGQCYLYAHQNVTLAVFPVRFTREPGTMDIPQFSVFQLPASNTCASTVDENKPTFLLDFLECSKGDDGGSVLIDQIDLSRQIVSFCVFAAPDGFNECVRYANSPNASASLCYALPYSNASCTLMPPSYDIVNKFAIRVREDTLLKYLVVAGVAALSLAIACIGCSVAYCRYKRQRQQSASDDRVPREAEQMRSVVDDEQQAAANSASDIPLSSTYV
jgi:hypothetical protein